MLSSTSCLGSCRLSTLRRDPKTVEQACCSRRCAQPFPLSHCCSEDNWACSPGSIWNSSWKETTHSVQATRWMRTQSWSRSPNQVPDSNESKPPPSTSRVDPHDDQKQNPPLNPNKVPFEAEKGYWTEKGCGGPHSIHGQTVDLWLWGLT